MPIIPEIQDRLRLAFPQGSDLPLYRAVQEGSYLANHLFEGESFLNDGLGRDIHGHLRRIGIGHQIDLYCTRGDLPWRSAIKPMPKGPWHWLEIIGTRAMAHVCRTEDVMDFPENADSRQDIRVALQTDLFTYLADPKKSLAATIDEIPQLYAWMTFRVAQDGRLSHLCWASPAADCDEYVGHINVLEQIARTGKELPIVNPVADPKEKLRLKDHVVQALGKSAEKKTGE